MDRRLTSRQPQPPLRIILRDTHELETRLVRDGLVRLERPGCFVPIEVGVDFPKNESSTTERKKKIESSASIRVRKKEGPGRWEKRETRRRTHWFFLSEGGTQGVAVHLCSMLEPMTVWPSTGMGVTTSEPKRKNKKLSRVVSSRFVSSLSSSSPPLPLSSHLSHPSQPTPSTSTHPKPVPTDASPLQPQSN